MSFVGPRPLLPVDQPAHPEIRFAVRPGLTGWAQINGGHLHLSKEDKGAMDIWYVRHASLWLDIQVILRTAVFIIRGERPPAPEVLEVARRELSNLDETSQSNETQTAGSPRKEAAITDLRLAI